MRKQVIVLAALGISSLSAGAHASVITDWDLTGMAGTEASKTPLSSDIGVVGSNLVRGAGLAGNAGANSMNTTGWNSQSTDYFSFGFTVSDGYSVDLSNLVIATKSSNTGPGKMGLYYSGDNFSSVLFTFDETSTYNGTTTAFLNSIVDLSALPNLTGNVEFRIAQIGASAANGGTTGANGTFRVAEYSDGTNFTDLQFNGTTSTVSAVPLPAAVWLFGSGLLGLFGIGRKRNASI